jgi:hypothetical protein
MADRNSKANNSFENLNTSKAPSIDIELQLKHLHAASLFGPPKAGRKRSVL